jgi:hypothetical protein
MLDNQFGVGAVKAVLAVLAAHFNTTTGYETMAASIGAQVLLVTKITKGKKGTDKEDARYLAVHKLDVL